MIPFSYKYQNLKGYPYKCDDFKCNCRTEDDTVRHCAVCGDLYYWNPNHPKFACLDCWAVRLVKKLEGSRTKFK